MHIEKIVWEPKTNLVTHVWVATRSLVMTALLNTTVLGCFFPRMLCFGVVAGADQVSFVFQVDFELLAENLVQLERRCKASWDNLKVVTKHETKAVLKNKLTEFLKDCTQRIIILKVVHRRVINRYTRTH